LLYDIKAGKVKCEKCGKTLKEDGIILPTLAFDEDIILCARCFEKMSMTAIWKLELSRKKA